MEYFIQKSGIKVGNKNVKCQDFLFKNKKIIDDCLTNTYPDIKPMFNVSNKKEFATQIKDNFKNKYIKKYSQLLENESLNKFDIDYQLFFLKYACFCDPSIILTATVDNKIKGYKSIFEVDINDKMLLYINLQLHFLRDKFDEFKEYIFNTLPEFEKYPFKKLSKMNDVKDKKLRIYLTNKSISKNALFESKGFFELIESAKIFLNNNNYKFLNEWSNTNFLYNLEETFITFFRIRFLKFYMHHNYKLLQQEQCILLGSYLLFCMGLRSSRDTDIYSLFYFDEIPCKYDLKNIPIDDTNYSFWENMILNPFNHYCIFGFKSNNLDIEIFRRKERYNSTNSRKTLTDLIVLSYLKNQKIEYNNDLQKMLHFRYPKLIKIISMHNL